MADIFIQLKEVLRSKQVRLTSGESKVLLVCESQALRQFTMGALVGSGVTWLATWRLNRFLRVNLSFGTAVVFGLQRFGKSMESSVDHILATDGSQLQKELATIIVNKYRDDPRKMQLLSKHFYSEKVYDDSASNQAKLRWRYKNYFSDNVAHGQRTPDTDSYGESHSDSKDNSQKEPHYEARSAVQNDPDRKKNDLRSKHVPVDPNVDMIADPLDCVFGHTATVEEICHPSTSSMPTGVHIRSHRRSHRRHRLRHHDLSLDPQHA